METTEVCETKSLAPNTDKKIENGSKICEDSAPDAEEEMVTSESKTPLKTPVKEMEVKFIVNDSINGDAKIDLDNVRAAFAGMAKEELMKYANDPFWVQTRLFLFVIFWIIWFSMLIGAIVIIVTAPRCETPKRREWFQKGPLYELELESFVNNPDSESLLHDLKLKLDYITELDVKGLILSPIFKALDGEENVIDYRSIQNHFGTLNDVKELTKAAKEKGIHILLSFVPNHSSNKHDWFNKSVARESPYESYYVWAPASKTDTNGTRYPPNNWLSLSGGSAWEWNAERGEFYLHQFNIDQPDLNFHNPAVLKEFNDTLSFWLDLGITGFNLDKVQYLLEDKDLENEQISRTPGYGHTEYNFYLHGKTNNLPGVATILSSWKDTIKAKTDNNGVLIITGDIPKPSDSNQTDFEGLVVDLARSDKLLSDLNKDFTAQQLYHNIERTIPGKSWTSVQLGGRNMTRVIDRFGADAVDGLNMIALLLPATPVTFFGEELGLEGDSSVDWGNDTDGVLTQRSAAESHLKVYKTLIEARDTPAVLYGNLNLTVLNSTQVLEDGQQLNTSVLVLTRVKVGNPGYLVVYNPSPHNVSSNLNSLEYMSVELTVLARSLNYGLDGPRAKDKVNSKQVFLTPRSALAFTFIPQTE